MKKFVLIAFFLTFNAFAQDCSCEENFLWVKKTFEENDAGFQVALDRKGKAEYEMAYGKLKAKDYDGAIAGFKSQIAQYPNSEYSGNSHFWLGFIYQTKGDSTTAAKSFSTLIDKFPSHAKTPDAKYNLGKIYHQQGNTAKAKELLKDVASGTSKSAPLAKSYLESL